MPRGRVPGQNDHGPGHAVALEERHDLVLDARVGHLIGAHLDVDQELQAFPGGELGDLFSTR
jgi:hypothetical protein